MKAIVREGIGRKRRNLVYLARATNLDIPKREVLSL